MLCAIHGSASASLPKEIVMTTQRPTMTSTTRYCPGLAFAAIALAGTGLLGCAEAAEEAGPSGDITHPEDDVPGSQVRLHEGTDGPVFEAAVVQTPGMDVSSHQGAVNWSTAWANGARFAYVKATEGTTYQNPDFAQQYNGSFNIGMIRGAYHFALPDRSSGATQGNFFVCPLGGG